MHRDEFESNIVNCRGIYDLNLVARKVGKRGWNKTKSIKIEINIQNGQDRYGIWY